MTPLEAVTIAAFYGAAVLAGLCLACYVLETIDDYLKGRR